MALSLAAKAQIIPIVNGDFEANTVKTPFFQTTGAIATGAVPGWTPAGTGVWSWGGGQQTGDSGIDLPSGSDPTTHAYLAGYDPAIYQDTTTPTSGVNDFYRLTFSAGGEWSSMSWHNTLATIYATDGSERDPIGSGIVSFNDNYTMNTYSVWGQDTTDFMPGDGWTIGVEFQNVTLQSDGTNPGWGTSYTTIDNVVLENMGTVPEPSTIALLTLGGLGALVAIRRRRA